jgi:hypothetical protein
MLLRLPRTETRQRLEILYISKFDVTNKLKVAYIK